MAVGLPMSTTTRSDDTQKLMDEIHDEVREHGEKGEAAVIGDDLKRHPSVVFWDGETGQWLFAAYVDGRWHRFPTQEFPHGMEIMVAWGEYEFQPVEETDLYHGTYGLDPARDGGAA